MNGNHSPPSNRYLLPPRGQRLSSPDFPGCVIQFAQTRLSTDDASIVVGGRETSRLLLFRDSMRGLVDIFIQHGTVPSDTALLAMGRTIMDHLATVPEWRDVW